MEITLLLITIGVISTILIGAYFIKTKKKSDKKGLKKVVAINILSILLLVMIGFISDTVFAMDTQDAAVKAVETSGNGLGYIGAALSTGLAAVGAGIGVGQAGAAAIGAISEDETVLGKTLIILGLAEGVAIYGLVISIMILQKL